MVYADPTDEVIVGQVTVRPTTLIVIEKTGEVWPAESVMLYPKLYEDGEDGTVPERVNEEVV